MRHHADELSRGRCFWFFGALRSLEGIPVAARDRSNAASYVLVHFVWQIGQGHAQRPVWRLEAAAVQQHNPMILGQTEGEVERVDILLKIFDGVLPDILASKELEVD